MAQSRKGRDSGDSRNNLVRYLRHRRAPESDHILEVSDPPDESHRCGTLLEIFLAEKLQLTMARVTQCRSDESACPQFISSRAVRLRVHVVCQPMVEDRGAWDVPHEGKVAHDYDTVELSGRDLTIMEFTIARSLASGQTRNSSTGGLPFDAASRRLAAV